MVLFAILDKVSYSRIPSQCKKHYSCQNIIHGCSLWHCGYLHALQLPKHPACMLSMTSFSLTLPYLLLSSQKKKKKSFPYQLLQCIFMLAVQLINKATDKPIAFYRILHHFLHCFSNSKKHFIFWLLENKAPKKNTKNNYKEVLDCLI